MGWACAYFFAHVIGVAFADPERRVAAIWPASGVSLAAVISTPQRRWPVTIAVIGGIGFVVNIVLEGAPLVGAGFFVANAAECALGAFVLTRMCKRDVTFTRVDEVLALTGAAIVANAVTGFLGAGSPWLFVHAPFWPTYWTWLSTNVLGTVLVAPLAIVWTRPVDATQPPRPAETALFAAAWCAAVWITTHTTALHGAFAPRPYMLLCLVPWAAFRLGLRTITAAMLLLCVAVSSAVVSGTVHPEFAVEHLADEMMQAQIYVGIVSLMGLLLGARTSEARHARAAESESATHLTVALDAARMGTWEWRVGGTTVHWSERVASMFGLPPGGFAGGFTEYLGLIHPDDRASVETAISRATQPGAPDYSIEHRILWPDGSVHWLACRGRVERDATGKPTRMAGTVVEITEQQHVAERLRQTQKMEAIGQLAGGVAHDFNNILATIRTQAEVARRDAAASDVPTLLEEIVASTERGASLTKQLLAFARRQVLQPKPLDLNGVVSDITSMLRRILRENVRMRVDLTPRALVTRADAGLLGQALVNLVLNASDAMPDGGELVISTGQTVVAEGDDGEEAPPGTYAVIRVADTGCGIPKEHLARLFEPFFTTKAPGKGTGLGLATLFGVVKLHHGFVRVESEVGKGTTFELLLPPSDEEVVPASSPPVASERAAKPDTILLVDDDANLRKTTRMLLQMSGYAVVEAGNGVEALRVWGEHAKDIGLLLTDMTMPEGLDGRQLAAELRRLRPELKVILTSGYHSDFAGGGGVVDGERFLLKPCPIPELLEAVKHALEA